MLDNNPKYAKKLPPSGASQAMMKVFSPVQRPPLTQEPRRKNFIKENIRRAAQSKEKAFKTKREFGQDSTGDNRIVVGT